MPKSIKKKLKARLERLKKSYVFNSELPSEMKDILHDHGEDYYEDHPTAPRSLETSELQDEIRNFHHGPEDEAYEKRLEKIKEDHVSDASPFQG